MVASRGSEWISSNAVLSGALAICGLASCVDGGDTTPVQEGGWSAPEMPGDDGDDARARRWLEPRTPLPLRAEVVALSDRLSIAASKAEQPPDKVRLAELAARLRERVWRFDRKKTDALEAVELFGQVIQARVGGLAACEADLKRARILGEMAADAGHAYRELYLALRRQTASEEGRELRRPCVLRVERMLATVQAFRPTGGDWQELEAEAATEASAQHARAAGAPSAAASAVPPAGLEPGGEVVVVPDASMIKDEKVLLQQVQPYSYKLGGRVVLSLSAPARYETGVLPPDKGAGRGHRVYLDLLNTQIKGPKKLIEAGGLIERVRIGKREGGTRVVVDLSDAAGRRIFYLPDPFRVVIDLSTRREVAATAQVAAGKRSVRRITLDAGHGGWDDGAVGPTGLLEKNVALDIAHRAAPTLASELGVETMLTRDTDVFVTLEERTARANAFQSDLFVSIHCNATENGQATGMEVYILDPSREQDKEALRVAHLENQSARKKGGVAVDAEVAAIALGLKLEGAAQGSRLFAELLRKSAQSSMVERYAGTDDHGIKTAGFFVLLGADMPAALFETAFISNPGDEARLATADFRQKLADSIVNAVKAYQQGHR